MSHYILQRSSSTHSGQHIPLSKSDPCSATLKAEAPGMLTKVLRSAKQHEILHKAKKKKLGSVLNLMVSVQSRQQA
jgi:hypothetical protein